MSATEDRWNQKAQGLEGRTIVKARYLTREEAQALGWYKRPIVLQLDDGSLLFPSQDDEGNNGGALFMQGPNGEDDGFPVL